MGSKLSLLMSVSCAALLLAGCEDGEGLGSSRPDASATAAADRPAATRLVERDVEAPEVFQKAEAGLWDGRPSLGGVWVAHPDVTDPERVIIRNEANGQFVIGALFRRERDNPGPRFQVSSDAAAELGLLAGAPTRLNVTALRREEAPSAEPEPVAEEAVAETQATEDPADVAPVTAPAAATVATAAAAIDRAEAAEGETQTASTEEAGAAVEAAPETAEAEPARERRGWGPFRRRDAAPLTATGTAVATAAAGTVVAAANQGAQVPAPQSLPTPAAAPAPQVSEAEVASVQLDEPTVVPTAQSDAPRQRTGWNPFRRKSPEPLSAMAPADIAATAAVPPAPEVSAAELAAVQLDDPGVVPAAQTDTPRQRTGWNPFRRQSQAPLSATAPADVTAAAAGTVIATPEIETQALPQATPAAARAPQAPASQLDLPYVQIGIFSEEGNATRTAETMRRNGVVPTVYQQEAQGRTFWRVVVGPAMTGGDQTALLRKVRGLGFDDAYAVAR